MFQTNIVFSVGVVFLLTTLAFANQPKIESRIVNGSNAVRGQFPYYAFIRIQFKDTSTFCGGSLISNEWVLTAAHCISGARAIQVHLGTTSVQNWKEIGRNTVSIASIKNQVFVHPEYSLNFISNDIGLIKLQQKLTYSDVIRPVNGLACSSNNNLDVIAIGNGRISQNESIPRVLQYANMKTFTKNKCFIYLPNVAFRSGMICAKGDDNQSICNGDSGGPLVETKSQKLVGISSFGSRLFGCTYGFPQAFTYIPEYLKWIQEITGIACKKDD